MVWENKINSNPYSIPHDYIGPQPDGWSSPTSDFPDRVTRDEADVVVLNGQELWDAIDAATSGDIIWLDETQTADVTDLPRYKNVPSGVTIASDGGRIYQSDPKAAVFNPQDVDNVRFTGLRFEGNFIGQIDNYDASLISRGIIIRGTNVRVDHCEFYGWTSDGVFCGRNSDTPEDHWAPHIHHCIFRDNCMDGLGYGITVYSGSPHIEYCYFNNNRHSIATGGRVTCEYEVNDCYHGPNTMIDAFEQHDHPNDTGSTRRSGKRTHIHHCEFEHMIKNNSGDDAPVFRHRGVPIDDTDIHNNHLHNPYSTPDNTRSNSPQINDSPGQQIFQSYTGGDTFVDMYHYDNYYGETGAPSSVGTRDPTAGTVGPGTGGEEQPAFEVVDDFDRSTIGSAWDDGTGSASVASGSSWRGTGGMYVPEGQSVISMSGLENYPERNGGPDNDGSFAVAYRHEVSGGTGDIVRIQFALQDASFANCYRFQDDSNGINLNLRQNGTTSNLATFSGVGGSTDPTDGRVIRVLRWDTDGFDVAIHRADFTTGTVEEELARESNIPTPANYSGGGVGVWTNATTAFSVDEWILGDDHDAASGSGGLDTNESYFEIRADRDGLELSELVADVSASLGDNITPEGLTYHNGQLYTGTREGPGTIYEWNLNGTPTGGSFTLPDPDSGHLNAMVWHNNELWVSSSDGRRTYIVDWSGSTSTVVDTIEYEGTVANFAWRAIVPDWDGERKLLFVDYRGDAVWVVDAAGARAAGTTAGYVDRSISTGYWHNVQTMHWDGTGGAAYTTTHEHIIKHNLPDFDTMGTYDPLFGHDIEYVHPVESEVLTEQLTRDPSTGEFYVLDRGGTGGRILSGQEQAGVYDNGDFGHWDAIEEPISSHLSTHTRHVNSDSTEYVRFNYGETTGQVTTWFYDNGGTSKRVYPAVEDINGDAVNIGVAVHQPFGNDNYGFWDGSWHDTGIARTSGWIGFRWNADGNAITASISTDGGSTWQSAGVSSRSVGYIRGIRIQRYAGWARVGPWTARVDRPEVAGSGPGGGGTVGLGERTVRWDDEPEWDDDLERERVVSSSLGSRVGGSLQLGFDPDDPNNPISDAVGYWPLDDPGSSSTLEDAIGPNDATINGATVNQPGVLSSESVHFGGDGDHLTIPNDGRLSFGGSFTIHAVVYPDVFQTGTVFRNGFTEGGTIFMEVRDANRVSFGWYNASNNLEYKSTWHYGALPDNQWIQLVGIHNASTNRNRVFMNGTPETEPTGTSRPSPAANQEAWVGYRDAADQRPYTGRVDEVAMWDRALSGGEVGYLWDTFSSGWYTSTWRPFEAEDTGSGGV